MKFKKYIWSRLFILNIIFILIMWLFNNPLNGPISNYYILFSRITALVGTYLILIQLVLIGRIKFLENLYGHDKLTRFHHYNGIVAFFLILLHGIFIILGYKIIYQISFFAQFATYLGSDEISSAIIALFLLIIAVITSIKFAKMKIKYEYWFIIHLITYIVIILAFGHQLEKGLDLRNTVFYAYWIILYIVTVGLLVIYRLLIPLYNFYKHRFEVSKIVIENKDITSVYITGYNMDQFKFNGGQFGLFRFLSGWLSIESHPFSFSHNYSGNEIRITVKNLGDFTSKIKNIKKGTKVFIEGPLGVFNKKEITKKNVLFIAGGIGITSINSLIGDLKNTNLNLNLIYSVKKEDDFVFKKELESINCKYHVSSKEGRLSKEIIQKYILNKKDIDVFICGPPMMNKHLLKILKEIGVLKKNIHFEMFSF